VHNTHNVNPENILPLPEICTALRLPSTSHLWTVECVEVAPVELGFLKVAPFGMALGVRHLRAEE
jgi:hypothetical protein